MLHEWIALVVFIAISVFGISLCVLGIAGTFAIALAAVIYNIISWKFVISPNILATLLGLALLGEILEWVVTLACAKVKGVSRYGLMGTVIGAFLGAIALSIVPLIGTIIGFILGAILGAFVFEFYDKLNTKKAWKAAKAALLSRGIVMAMKTAIGIIQLTIILKGIQ